MTPTPPPAAPVPASADTDLMLVERAVAGVQLAVYRVRQAAGLAFPVFTLVLGSGCGRH